MLTLGAAVLFGGCHKLAKHADPFDAQLCTPRPSFPNFEIVNAGYNETNWMSLAPTGMTHGFAHPLAEVDPYSEVQPYSEIQEYSEVQPYSDTPRSAETATLSDSVEEMPAPVEEISIPTVPPVDDYESSATHPPQLRHAVVEDSTSGAVQKASFVDDAQDILDFIRH